MIRCQLSSAQGLVKVLPRPLAWKMEYTSGTPCDSFSLTLPWEGLTREDLRQGAGFSAWRQGEQVFRGVVDEFTVYQDKKGRRCDITGRGMAALLLDNEALSADYATATLEDILRDHVRPYGITAAPAALPPVEHFTVAAGSSEWQVVYEFARYYGGVNPRFDRTGRLVLTPWETGKYLVMDHKTPVTEVVCREKRYGVLSQVVVRDRFRQTAETVGNEEFMARGGRRRQVVTMPGRSHYQAMRYRGDFQIQRSKAKAVEVKVTVAKPFYAWPGDLVELALPGCPCNGRYRVLEAQAALDEGGYRTGLTLGDVDAVL